MTMDEAALEKPVAVEPAATVILLRERPGQDVEVLLTRRKKSLAFMGGAFVFPGGRVDRADEAFAASGSGLDFDPALCTAAAAAIRETFEEVGLLLARGPEGQSTDEIPDGLLQRLAGHRDRLLRREAGFYQMVKEEGLDLALDRLRPYARWITPLFRKKRFDTWFFVARCPEGQVAVSDDRETSEVRWMSPPEALDENGGGRLMLMPPTLKTLHEFSAFHSAREIFRWAEAYDKSPIFPESFSRNGSSGLLLPHDEEYTMDDYRRPANPGEPSRLTIDEDGRWRLVGPSE